MYTNTLPKMTKLFFFYNVTVCELRTFARCQYLICIPLQQQYRVNTAKLADENIMLEQAYKYFS